MCVHITTGNKVDVIQELVEGKFVVVGIKPWGGELISLPDPKALAEVILDNLSE